MVQFLAVVLVFLQEGIFLIIEPQKQNLMKRKDQQRPPKFYLIFQLKQEGDFQQSQHVQKKHHLLPLNENCHAIMT